MLRLVARCGSETLQFPVPVQEATLGSSRGSDLVLRFRGISRRHARLSPVPGGVRVVDCGSKNGLERDGVRLPEVYLRPGEGILLGFCSLTLEDVPSSDLELGLALDASPPLSSAPVPSAGTSTLSDGRPNSPAAALLFVREVEDMGPGSLESDPRAILERARALLGAGSLLLFTGDDAANGPVAVMALAGSLPAADLLEDLGKTSAVLGESAGSAARLVNGRLVAMRAGGPNGLAAVFSPSVRDVPAWRRDLFGYLARKFLAGTPVRPEKPAERERRADLRIPPGMVLGKSPAIARLLEHLQAAARSRVDVLLQGESGTGKELFARMVHASGPASNGPFIAINCAAIPSELLEAELFGVQRGVATGVDARPGRFAQADGGTIFLDEVGELAEPLQAKLLRVLQEREILPLGAPVPRRIDVRVISASNRDLLELTRERRFRADLYYRLRGVQYQIPPLRDRKEDIPDLVLVFLSRASQENEKGIRGISRKALGMLLGHDWPGNVRELESDIRRAVLLCPSGGLLQAEHFADIRWAIEQREAETRPAVPGVDVAGARDSPRDREQEAPAPEDLDLRRVRDAAEKAAIESALMVAKGNKTLAARLLKISRNGLAARLAALKITW